MADIQSATAEMRRGKKRKKKKKKPQDENIMVCLFYRATITNDRMKIYMAYRGGINKL